MKRSILCISMLCLFVGFVLASPQQTYRTTPTPTTLYGSIVSGKSPVGIYSTTTENPPTVQSLKAIQSFKPAAGVYANGNYYLISALVLGGQVRAAKLEKYDISTWTAIQSLDPGTILPTTLTYNTKDSKAYGCFPNSTNGFDFCTFNLDNCERTVIAALDQQFVALFSDNSGNVYGVGLDGTLYLFNLATGVPSSIGATGLIPSKDTQDACFDETTGTVYWFARTAMESALYTVNTTNGNATKVTDFENYKISWCGVFAQPQQKPLKPAFITKMRAEFVTTNLTGNFIFTLPDKAETGESLSGKLAYKVYLDDVEYNVGEGNPGEEITIPVTVAQEGKHKFSVYASQNELNGQITSIEKFIGQDTPKAPGYIKAVKESGSNNVTIAWTPVTEGVNSGYINVEAIKYNLVRLPDNVLVGANITTTTFTDNTIYSMNNYSYVITATDGVKTSEAVTSNTLLVAEDLGILPPYENSFLDGKGLGFFTTLDANNDGFTWTYNEKNVFYYPSSQNAADDWLVSPKFRLEKGKYYNLSITLMVSDVNKVEKFEIKYGAESQANAMTNTICSEKSTSSSYTINEWITPNETGCYYIGIHALSDKAQGALGVMNFKLTAGIDQNSPSEATDIIIKAGAMGELSSQISFTCPTINFGKTPLTEITQVVVTNVSTNTIVASKNDVQPGQKINVTDYSPQAGMNQYSIICYNSAGAGIVATEECWIGFDAPASPLKVSWIQKGSQAIITWEAPTIGKHGGYIDPSKLTYSIYNPELQVEVKSGLQECTYTDDPQITELQSSLLYLIYATNEYGTSEPAYSNYSAFGTGYECPFKESFSDRKLHTLPWIINQVSGKNVWQLIADIAPTGTPQDNDKGMIGYSAVNPGSARLESPIIDIANQDKPALKLWYYMFDKVTDLRIKVSNDCGANWEEVATLPKDVLNQWTIATVDLTNYKSYNHLQIGIEAANTTPGNPVFVDNITVDANFDYDLAIQELNIPASTQAGTTLNASVLVVNNGYKTVDNYQLECYVDGELFTTLDGKQLTTDGLENLKLEIPVSINSDEELEIKCKVVYSNDEKASNNEITKVAPIAISQYPRPSDLKAAEANQNDQIVLTWTAPSTEFIPERTDDMESYEAWTVGGIDVVENKETHEMIVTQDRGTIGDYTLIDNDHLPTQYIWGASGKAIPHLGDGMVCQVIDVAKYGSNSSIMAAHSGDKMLCFWTSAQSDDYFILPELAENSKYISFWAKSLSNKYGLESFEIMVSTTGKEISDFTVFATKTDVPVGYKTDPEAGYTF